MSDSAQTAAGCRRCTICALSLPNDPAWEKCPKCGESTDIIVNAGPNTTVAEATSLLRAREFEEYLEKEKRT
jgi:hypothetical protein